MKYPPFPKKKTFMLMPIRRGFIGNNTIVNCGIGISVPHDAEIDIVDNNISKAEKAVVLTDDQGNEIE